MMCLVILLMMRIFFQFSSEAEFIYVHITLATDTEAESPYFAQLQTSHCLK